MSKKNDNKKTSEIVEALKKKTGNKKKRTALQVSKNPQFPLIPPPFHLRFVLEHLAPYILKFKDKPKQEKKLGDMLRMYDEARLKYLIILSYIGKEIQECLHQVSSEGIIEKQRLIPLMAVKTHPVFAADGDVRCGGVKGVFNDNEYFRYSVMLEDALLILKMHVEEFLAYHTISHFPDIKELARKNLRPG